MNKKFQVGMLVLLLVLPALFFALFGIFSESKFKKLPMLNPQVPECPENYEGDTVHHVPPFSFINQDGEIVTDKDFRGKIYIADLIFTRCPDVCIALSSEMKRVHETLEDFEDVRYLSHTIDPAFDTPEVLAEYAKRYSADTKRWIFVTGDKVALYKQARCGYYLLADEVNAEKLEFNHSDKVALIDKEGRIRGYYAGTDREEMDKLITEVQILLKEYERK